MKADFRISEKGWCHILTFFTADTEENHYEFHEISLRLCVEFFS